MIHFHFSLQEIKVLRKLGVFRRLIHPTARRHIIGVSLGFGLMMTGSSLALNHWKAVPHALWDCGAYLIHGIGTIPILKHIEPLWALILLEKEIDP